MDLEIDPDWPTRMIQAREAVTPGERNRLAAAARAGRLVRLARGVYVDAEEAANRTSRQRHRDLLGARQLVSPEPPVFSHASAAALWRLPRVGDWPAQAHIVADRASGGRSTVGVTHHRLGLPSNVDTIDGLRVTTLARTVADLALSDSVENSLVAADAAFRGLVLSTTTTVGLDRTELVAQLAGRPSRGRARARFVASFADGASGSPGETLSRLAIHRAGLPAPALQMRFVDAQGTMYVDFFWPESGLIGEFDGVAKYLRTEWMDGRSAAEVVIDEKWREDRLRALGWRVVRWGWAEARSMPRLRGILTSAGLR